MKASEITEPGFYWFKGLMGDVDFMEVVASDIPGGRLEVLFLGEGTYDYTSYLDQLEESEVIGPVTPPAFEGKD